MRHFVRYLWLSTVGHHPTKGSASAGRAAEDRSLEVGLQPGPAS